MRGLYKNIVHSTFWGCLQFLSEINISVSKLLIYEGTNLIKFKFVLVILPVVPLSFFQLTSWRFWIVKHICFYLLIYWRQNNTNDKILISIMSYCKQKLNILLQIKSCCRQNYTAGKDKLDTLEGWRNMHVCLFYWF